MCRAPLDRTAEGGCPHTSRGDLLLFFLLGFLRLRGLGGAFFRLLLTLLYDFWFSRGGSGDRKSTRLNSSHLVISYAVFCLKKKKRFYQPALLIHTEEIYRLPYSELTTLGYYLSV